jgi:hypothetical protein
MVGLISKAGAGSSLPSRRIARIIFVFSRGRACPAECLRAEDAKKPRKKSI